MRMAISVAWESYNLGESRERARKSYGWPLTTNKGQIKLAPFVI
jgi:hypothetical protein